MHGCIYIDLYVYICFVSFSNIQIVSLFQSGVKGTVLDLAKLVDKGVQVKLTGGRQG